MTTLDINQQSISEKVLQFVNQTDQCLFITGEAGSGKTTLLKYITEHTYKKNVVAAPTGIAAINAGGVTLHSLFQLPFGGFIPEDSLKGFDGQSGFNPFKRAL